MLIRGDRLPAATRQEIFRAWLYRYTVENPRRHLCGATRTPIPTDAEWLRSYCFYVTRTGRLDARVNRAEPCYGGEDDCPGPLPWEQGYAPAGKGKQAV